MSKGVDHASGGAGAGAGGGADGSEGTACCVDGFMVKVEIEGGASVTVIEVVDEVRVGATSRAK